MRNSIKKKKSPGRPRQFDEKEKLQKAMQVFWKQGYSGTSLDNLSDAMELTRPSIYNAFGGKEDIYRAALSEYMSLFDTNFEGSIRSEKELVEGINDFFESAIDLYSSGNPALGCFLACTAPAEAITSETVRSDLSNMIAHIDKQFHEGLSEAIERSSVILNNSVELISQMLQSLLHTVAIRARAGQPASELKSFANRAITVIVS